MVLSALSSPSSMLVLHPPPGAPSSSTPGRPDCPLSSSNERSNPPLSELLGGGGQALGLCHFQSKPAYPVERRYQTPYHLAVRYLSPRRYTCLPTPHNLAPYGTGQEDEESERASGRQMEERTLPLFCLLPLRICTSRSGVCALLRPLGAPWTLPHALLSSAMSVPLPPYHNQHRAKCGYRSTPDSQRGEDEELGEFDEEKREAKIKDDQDDPPALHESPISEEKGIPSLRIVTILGSFRATRLAIEGDPSQSPLLPPRQTASPSVSLHPLLLPIRQDTTTHPPTAIYTNSRCYEHRSV
ncbi:hypothetical protein CORC01_13510 [Colletotrichum orchidophilum]|uniref:Uncharacterized protein n=1 Tax=Colletotrichum orchidophilum TaxID=1209926 RepID=A0A1G4APV2_9PEZI|nr:uncharacterized protein CORC01_13510 [Colletotrichum orchidophilum]OHE91199.1 hypothetical protein CORC01_13510 [Colletotrichum orchidophilum]